MADFALSATAATLEKRIRENRLMSLPGPWANDEVVFPSYDGLSLLNIPHTMAALLGGALPNPSPLAPEAFGDAPPQDIQRVVVFLTDGLGYLWLQQLLDEDDALRQAVHDLTEGRGLVPLTSVAPSTTANALPTLWTGAGTAQHGMVGTLAYLEEINMVADLLTYRPMPSGAHPGDLLRWRAIDPKNFIPVPGVSEILAQQGIPTHSLLYKDYIGSGLSLMLHRGVEHHHPHLSLSDFWLRVHNVLQQTRRQKCVVQIYWPAVDALSHAYGAQSDFVRHEVHEQFLKLRDIVTRPDVQDGKTALLIFADHGHYDVKHIITLRKDPKTHAIADGLGGLLTGDMRFAYMQARHGAKAAIVQAVQENYADALTTIDVDEAIQVGLFGPPQATERRARRRLGDLVLLSRLGWAVDEPALHLEMVSMHAGLSDWEMLIPFMWRKL